MVTGPNNLIRNQNLFKTQFGQSGAGQQSQNNRNPFSDAGAASGAATGLAQRTIQPTFGLQPTSQTQGVGATGGGNDQLAQFRRDIAGRVDLNRPALPYTSAGALNISA